MELRHGFVDEIKSIIEQSRVSAIRSVDHIRVKMYWELGRKIVEEEQEGKQRAEYGSFLIKNLSVSLTVLYGSGFTVRRLHLYRQFFKTYPIVPAMKALLGWSHYKILISIDNQTRRRFYETECSKNNWTYRQLERQINSQLYERLLLSNNPEDVLAVARSEKHPVDARELITTDLKIKNMKIQPLAFCCVQTKMMQL